MRCCKIFVFVRYDQNLALKQARMSNELDIIPVMIAIAKKNQNAAVGPQVLVETTETTSNSIEKNQFYILSIKYFAFENLI